MYSSRFNQIAKKCSVRLYSSSLADEPLIEKLQKIASVEGISQPKMEIVEDPTAKAYLGQILKVDIEGRNSSGASKSLNLLAKIPHPKFEDPTQRGFIHDLYVREQSVYTHLFKNISEMQNSRGVTHRLSQHFAKTYGFSTDYCHEHAVFEDMRTKGYTVVDDKKPLDLAHSMVVLKALSRFHAISYALREWNDKLFYTYQQLFSYILPVAKEYRKTYEGKCMEALQTVEKDSNYYLKFEPFAKKFFDMLQESKDIVSPNGVLCHGDVRTANMLFKYDPKNPDIPTDIKLIDWQNLRFASPAIDLSYFFYTSMDENIRATEMDELLQMYFVNFNEVLKEFGCKETLSKDYFREDMERNMKLGLGLSCTTLHFITTPDSEQYNQRVRENIKHAVDRRYL